MANNNLRQSLFVVLGVLLILLIIRFLPEFAIGGMKFKRVDILSDIIKHPTALSVDTLQSMEMKEDSIDLPPLPAVEKPEFVDSCKAGMTCIEDFSDSTSRGMSAFYEALDRCDSLPVRIAYFGDSFIEADILTAHLRELLQNTYGGCGVGFVNITSNVAGFRKSITHTFDDWKTYSVMHPENKFVSSEIGLSGDYFMADAGAWVQYSGAAKHIQRVDTCNVAQLFLKNPNAINIKVSMNGGSANEQKVVASNSIHILKLKGNIHSIRYQVEEADSTIFYGVTLDGTKGISLDNYSLRGSSGLNLSSVSDATMRSFNKYRPYDLIILHYGLNVASAHQIRYTSYLKGMSSVISKLKRNFPQASILVVSVSDRDYKNDDGELVTMPGIKGLVEYQRRLAAMGNVAFWNLFEAMGGEGSMLSFVEHKPSYANKDYTHINFAGGKFLAEKMFDVLTFGKEEYDRRKKYESE